jgi:hypothetical protein
LIIELLLILVAARDWVLRTHRIIRRGGHRAQQGDCDELLMES